MNAELGQLNLLLAWLWMLFGFLSGMALGMFFHREEWLGGYASLRRRMYRLGHISFFALGAVNLLFWLTAKNISAPGASLTWPSLTFALGAVTMPVCCGLMAHLPKTRMLFAIPIVSLITGAVLTLGLVARNGGSRLINHQPSTISSP